MKTAVMAIVALSVLGAATAPLPVAAAEGWKRLKDIDLHNAISARRMRLADGGELSFREDGTMRLAGQTIEHGYWKTDDKDRLCQDWRPQDEWVCVKVERKDDGKKLRFIDAEGGISVATYMSY